MKRKNNFPFAYFAIAYLFTWAFQLPVVLESQKIISLSFPPLILLLISTFGPFFSSFLLTFRDNGTFGVWQLLRKGFNFRMPVYIYLFVASMPLSTAFLAYLLTGGGKTNLNIFELSGTFIIYFFLGGSFGEEFGWRGYALPRLLKDYKVVTAGLIIGILWAGWHIPLFWVVGTSQFNTPIWLFFISVIASSLLYTQIFLRSSNNIFACLLFHTFTNITVEIFPIETVNGIDKRICYETFLIVTAAILLYLPNYRKLFSQTQMNLS